MEISDKETAHAEARRTKRHLGIRPAVGDAEEFGVFSPREKDFDHWGNKIRLVF